MKIRQGFVWGLVMLGLALGGNALAGDDDITLTGQFVWERRDADIPGDLKAVFTPSGEGTWDVMFYFEWEGEDRAWPGTAKGSLDGGSLEGEGIEERDRKRTFAFSGEIKDGKFTGEHGGLRDGEFRKAGTLTLSR